MDEGTGMTMAQSSSVQREPSMEEILASIRRIIEDNETSKKDEKAAPLPVSHQPPVETEARLADDELPRTPVEPLSQEQQVSPAAEPKVAAVREVSVRPADFLKDIVSIRPTVKPDISFSGTAAPVEPDPEIQEPGFGRNIDEPALKPEVRQADDAGYSPIVSEQSEHKIASAFSELSEAYQASRRKSLADAAEEMLRPMLREWLDENLPQLVEKLVREEIERIARGS